MFLDWCDDLDQVILLLKNVIKLLQWGIPMVLILFGMLDLGKAVMAGKEDEMKKAQGTLIKRCVYAIIIFFVAITCHLPFQLHRIYTMSHRDRIRYTWYHQYGWFHLLFLS